VASGNHRKIRELASIAYGIRLAEKGAIPDRIILHRFEKGLDDRKDTAIGEALYKKDLESAKVGFMASVGLSAMLGALQYKYQRDELRKSMVAPQSDIEPIEIASRHHKIAENEAVEVTTTPSYSNVSSAKALGDGATNGPVPNRHP
jgi:hypothetical protein